VLHCQRGEEDVEANIMFEKKIFGKKNEKDKIYG
jgi:hypothetical protein